MEQIKPTEVELDILNILWDGPATVREVNDQMSSRRPVGYTTTLKQMQIMHEKGLLKRRKEGKLHVYAAEISKESTRTHMMDRILSTLFQGSAANLVLHTLGSSKTSREELKEIRKFLDQLDDNL